MNTTDEHSPEHFSNYSIENKVLDISGSPRRNGNSDVLLKQILRGVFDRGGVKKKPDLMNEVYRTGRDLGEAVIQS